ncbi:MAG: class I SAM-dependent methyltransferase [Smithellaceae bacterium]
MTKNSNICPLCEHCANPVEADEFYLCNTCEGIFRSREYHLLPAQEKKRYLEHNNDVHDTGYRKFVLPVTSDILQTYDRSACGLDFGAGTGPVISEVLQEQGYDIVQYDPFFSPDSSPLSVTYDYIVCCEVIEHFCHPAREFALLKRLLKPGGRLYCMTHLYQSNIYFPNWYYKKDPSHVFFYRAETLTWIAHAHRYSSVTIRDRLAVFQS